MKKITLFLTVLTLITVGCVYDAPFAKKQKVSIDKAVVGAWNVVNADAAAAKSNEKLLVLQYTDSEYLVYYQKDAEGMYFRGYPIKIENKGYVQLQLIGQSKGDVKKEDRKYQLISYSLAGDILSVRIINPEVVKADLKTTDELMAAFLSNKDNEKLFTEPVNFKKAEVK